MASIAPYQRIKSLSPGRSTFDLSYSKKLTCDMGQLIPVMCDEAVPGDNFRIGNQLIVRFQPLVAPILHEINVYVHYFFVPYRILWDNSKTDSWEAFITGGVDGELEPVLPRWTPTINTRDSLWDYLGFPPDIVPEGAFPMSFPRNAYNLIYNEYYRDQTLIPEVALTNEVVLYRLWEKNYFFSALPWQQRGTAPAFVAGAGSAIWSDATINARAPGADNIWGTSETASNSNLYAGIGPNAVDNAILALNNNTVDLTSFGFDVSDLRTAFQVQKWLERNACSGARYVEFLQSHFGISFNDARLQRPEYIGGTKAPVIVSEVLQTSGTAGDTGYTDTPQGNLAGHGLTVDSNFGGSYTVPEFGLIMGIMSVMPRADYQQGIDRQWLHETKYDFFFPEFQNLSEQAIIQAEIYATDDIGENQTLFGYQGKYDHMRTKHNQCVSWMRSNDTLPNFDYWHLAIDYEAAPALNQALLNCVPSKRIFAVQDEPGLIVNFSNIIRAVRPMPIQSNPGLIDH